MFDFQQHLTPLLDNGFYFALLVHADSLFRDIIEVMENSPQTFNPISDDQWLYSKNWKGLSYSPEIALNSLGACANRLFKSSASFRVARKSPTLKPKLIFNLHVLYSSIAHVCLVWLGKAKRKKWQDEAALRTCAGALCIMKGICSSSNIPRL